MLEEAVREVTAGLRDRGRSFEIVVVENGSTDDTVAIANRLAGEISELRALSLPQPDYGRALRAGLLAAAGDVVVNFDVDFCDLGFLDRAVPMVEAPDGPAVVVGSKRTAGSAHPRGGPGGGGAGGFSLLLWGGFRRSGSGAHRVEGAPAARGGAP